MTKDSIAYPRGLFVGQVTADDIFAKFAIAPAFEVDDAEGDLERDVGLMPEQIDQIGVDGESLPLELLGG